MKSQGMKLFVMLVMVFGLSACSFTEPSPGMKYCDFPANENKPSCQEQPSEKEDTGADLEEDREMEVVVAHNPPMNAQVVNTESDAGTDTGDGGTDTRETTEGCKPERYCENDRLVTPPELFVSVEAINGTVLEVSAGHYEITGMVRVVIEEKNRLRPRAPEAREHEVVLHGPEGPHFMGISEDNIAFNFGGLAEETDPKEHYEALIITEEDKGFAITVEDSEGRTFYYAGAQAPSDYPEEYERGVTYEKQGMDRHGPRCDDGTGVGSCVAYGCGNNEHSDYYEEKQNTPLVLDVVSTACE